jgi:hypothetical protein
MGRLELHSQVGKFCSFVCFEKDAHTTHYRRIGVQVELLLVYWSSLGKCEFGSLKAEWPPAA